MGKLIAIDMESTGLSSHHDKLLGVGLYNGTKYGWFHNGGLPSNLMDYKQVYHGGSIDIKFLMKQGLPCRHDHDTMLMSSLLPDEFHDLEYLAVKYLKVKPWKKTVNRKKLVEETDEVVQAYNRKDCEYTYRLAHVLYKEMQKREVADYYERYVMPLRRELNTMEMRGIRLNLDKLEELNHDYGKRAKESEVKIREAGATAIKEIEKNLLIKAQSKVKTQVCKDARASNPAKYNALFNPQSSQQLLELFHLLGDNPKTWDGKASTATEALTGLGSPLSQVVLEYRKCIKYKQFFESWNNKRVGDILYPSYKQHTVVTGRLSSSDPNIQQVPVKKDPSIRDVFIPRDGNVFIIADYSQIELRLAAHFSEDPTLCKLIHDGVDFHGYVAKQLFNLSGEVSRIKEDYPLERTISKALVYLTIYNGSANRFKVSLQEEGIFKSIEECRAILKGFYKLAPVLRDYTFSLGYQVEKYGYVPSLFKRKIWVPREEARHKALNYKLQGSASELTAFGILEIVKSMGNIGVIVGLIHDEILIECKPEYVDKIKDIIQKNMVDRIQLKIPLKVDIAVGTTWGAK